MLVAVLRGKRMDLKACISSFLKEDSNTVLIPGKEIDFEALVSIPLMENSSSL